jgi:hypothetical protein
MSFFDSEFVRAEVSEISELQETLYAKIFHFTNMGDNEKIEHVDLLQKLLDKQQILYNRLSLSDDPEVKVVKENMLKTATSMGLPENVDMNVIFSRMTTLIKLMRDQIDTPD